MLSFCHQFQETELINSDEQYQLIGATAIIVAVRLKDTLKTFPRPETAPEKPLVPRVGRLLPRVIILAQTSCQFFGITESGEKQTETSKT